VRKINLLAGQNWRWVRRAELDELLRQKEDYEINQQEEERRLNLLNNEVLTQLHDVEDA
jgi:hypothetical protein